MIGQEKPRQLSITISMCGAILLMGLSVGCGTNPRYIYEDGSIHVGGDGEPIELVNNPQADNPSYSELMAFIEADPTDTHDYLDGGPRGYVCSDFAEDVHNNAEAAGIRAAWVGIDFEGEEEGHACNAFETTDRGLVYIDCTGGDGAIYLDTVDAYFLNHMNLSSTPEPEFTSWDTVAYIEIGEEYGRIDLDYAQSPEYSSYEDYLRKGEEFDTRLETYNSEVEEHNREVSNTIYMEGSAELARIEAWEARLDEEEQSLDALGEELGDSYYEQMGSVAGIHVHW